MKFNFQNKIIIALFILIFQFSFAQKKEGTIASEEVNVVKAYTPTISDASKIQQVPALDDEGNAKKEKINYNIFSFPVASIFTPAKGKAEAVDKAVEPNLFDNYLTLGAGNYGTLNGELFVTQKLSDNDYVGGMFRHFSSQGGINDLELDDHFSDTSIDLTYGGNYKSMSSNFNLGFQNQNYNWYGLPEGFGNTLTLSDRTDLIGGIDPQHSYNTIHLGGKLSFNGDLTNEANIKFSHFSDSFNSSENRFYVTPSLQFNVMDEVIKTDVTVDYVSGKFDKNYANDNTSPVKYGFTNFGLAPSLVFEESGWALNLGAAFFYSLDIKSDNSKFLIYPKITASYNLVEDLMIFYAGAEGNLEQNSYQNFVAKNPFLSPTLNVMPTDRQYDIYAGLKGKLANTVSYNVKASYVNERNKALFKSNDYNEDASNEDYAFGNSMQVVYDDMRTVSFSGDLKADFSDDVTFGVGGSFMSYTNDFQQEAWNLPSVKINSSIDFNVTPKWYGGLSVFYVGERKDQKLNTDIVYVVQPSPVKLPSYFDLNAHVGYKYNDQLTAFLRANNITNQAYQKWLDYPVQGFQIVVGANYKFDF